MRCDIVSYLKLNSRSYYIGTYSDCKILKKWFIPEFCQHNSTKVIVDNYTTCEQKHCKKSISFHFR